MKKYIGYIVAAFSALIGLFMWERGKRKTAESLNENLESKEKIQELQAKQDQNSASLTLEEGRREDVKKDANEEINKPVGDADIIDFFKKLQ